MRANPTIMQNILAASKRKIDHTLDLTFPDGSSFAFANSPLSLAKGNYTNDLETVGEIVQTLENASDQVSVGIQNKDKVLGIHFAQNWQKWRKAKAVIGRYYRDESGTYSQWKEMFRGAVQQPDATDMQVTFAVITDILAFGNIVANRTLAPPCPHPFKDAKTCAYAGSLTTCNHLLKSQGGCDGRENSEHYGGTENRYQIEANVPGTGGNTGGTGGGGIGNNCPKIDQYVLVRGENGKPQTKMAGFITEDDFLFNPISRTFHQVASVSLIKEQEIFEFVAANGAVGYSSKSHPIIQAVNDSKGLAVAKLQKNDPVLTYFLDEKLIASKAILAQSTGEFFDVIKIELKDGHIYCYSNSAGKFIVCHNWKVPEDL